MNRSVAFIFLVLIASLVSAQQSQKLVAGPMLGYVEYREVLIWLEVGTSVNEVEVSYRQKGTKEWTEAEYQGQLHRQFNPIKIALAPLEPGTEYEYEIWIDEKKQAFPYPLQFKTRELWEYRKPQPDFSFIVGSCAYVNDSLYDRPGQAYGRAYHIFESIANTPADMMLWIGDNTYLREVDYRSPYGIWYRNSHTRRLPQMQHLLASKINYAVWDDHDYGPNDADGSYELKDTSLEIFKAYWGNKSYGTSHTPGVFGRFTWSDAEFFLLDDRYYRGAQKLPNNDTSRTFLGRAQLDWLKTALASSWAPFKFIVCGNQVINALNSFECYRNYGVEYTELMDFIVKQKISGVVFLSGDRHLTEIEQWQPDGFYTIYDITSSPLTSGPYTNPEKELNNPGRVAGTLLTENNYVRISITGEPTNRKLTVEAFDANGQKKWEQVIPQSAISLPK